MGETNTTFKPSQLNYGPTLPVQNQLSNDAIITLSEALNEQDVDYVLRSGSENTKSGFTFKSQVQKLQKKRVLVVGSVGAGKSSLINILADKSMTTVSDTAHGYAQDISPISIEHKDVQYEFIDTPGLDAVSNPERASNEAIAKLFQFLASDEQNFSCVLFVWRKGRIDKTFHQSTALFKNGLIKRSTPFVLVVTGCEVDNELASTRESIVHDLENYQFDNIVFGTTLCGGDFENYLAQIRKNMKDELWQCIEESCHKSSSETADTPENTLTENNSPLWWYIISSLYELLVKGYSIGKSKVSDGWVYVMGGHYGQDGHAAAISHDKPVYQGETEFNE